MKLFKKIKQNQIQCLACFNYCLISEGKTGLCGVRQNKRGELKLLVDNKAAAVNLDPLEKKPFFHFLPGTFAFSFGTFGCNFGCEFCQNWDISQTPKLEKLSNLGEEWLPEQIIEYCLSHHFKTIAYTYNEPTVWTEYALKTMKLAKKYQLKNVWVSNGYFSPQTLKLIAPYLDAINIDLKSYQEDFYHKIVHASLAPVKKNIQEVWKLGIWEEVTTLIIPTLNDSTEELKQMAKFLVEISPDLPWHLSAFYPAYRLLTVPSTPQKTLIKAYQIGKNTGLRYVYTGNIPDQNYESTFCPNCGEKIIERLGIEMIQNNLKNGRCPKCEFEIKGRWE